MITTILLVAAFVCFLLGAVGVPMERLNLTNLGLALYIASLIFA